MKRERQRIRWAKWIDACVGPVLIVALPWYRKFRGRISANGSVSDPGLKRIRKILFIKFWGIGSLVLSEPALRYLKRQYPNASIHYLTLRRNRELFDLLPGVKRVHSLSFQSWKDLIRDSFRLSRILRKEHFDLVFDAEFFANFSGLVARAAGGRVVGFSRDDSYKKHLQDLSVPFADDRHASAQFLALVREGEASDRLDPRPRLLFEDSAWAPSLARRTEPFPGPNASKYLVMNVNASPLAFERRWSRNNFVQLGRALLEAYDVEVVLCGSAAERSYVDEVEQGLPETRVHNLCGVLGLKDLAHLLRGAACLISNDSGPVHMASALGTPVIGFYGPETPSRYGPLSDLKLVFYEDLWCSPCMSVDNAKTVHCVNDLACMIQIEPIRVIQRVRQFIDAYQLLDQKQKGAGPARRAAGASYA